MEPKNGRLNDASFIDAHTTLADCNCVCTVEDSDCTDIDEFYTAVNDTLNGCGCVCDVTDAKCQATDRYGVAPNSNLVVDDQATCGCKCPLTDAGCKAANQNTAQPILPDDYITAHAPADLSECGCYCDATDSVCQGDNEGNTNVKAKTTLGSDCGCYCDLDLDTCEGRNELFGFDGSLPYCDCTCAVTTDAACNTFYGTASGNLVTDTTDSTDTDNCGCTCPLVLSDCQGPDDFYLVNDDLDVCDCYCPVTYENMGDAGYCD